MRNIPMTDETAEQLAISVLQGDLNILYDFLEDSKLHPSNQCYHHHPDDVKQYKKDIKAYKRIISRYEINPREQDNA